MQKLIEIVGLFLLSSVKFLFAPSASVAAGYGFVETLIITISGGVFGVFLFFFSGSWILAKWGAYFPNKNPSKKFSRKNKLIVSTKNKFGVIGLAILMGVISIPLASFLAARYFRYNPRTIPYLIASICLWSLGLTFFSIVIKNNLV